MLTFDDRCKVKNRYLEYCKEKQVDSSNPGHFLVWLGMMGLLDDEAVKDLLKG